MDAAGNPREGWMALVPVTVLVLVVTYVLGGPAHVVNFVAQWSMDVVNAFVAWVKHL
jgi:hypothetical protein